MVRHICMFTMKEENKEKNIAAFLERAESLKELEMIKKFQVVRNAENTPASNYDVALIFDFESEIAAACSVWGICIYGQSGQSVYRL